MKQFPEAQQLYISILNYMHSDSFRPKVQLTEQELKELFSGNVTTGSIKKLGNISYE